MAGVDTLLSQGAAGPMTVEFVQFVTFYMLRLSKRRQLSLFRLTPLEKTLSAASATVVTFYRKFCNSPEEVPLNCFRLLCFPRTLVANCQANGMSEVGESETLGVVDMLRLDMIREYKRLRLLKLW